MEKIGIYFLFSFFWNMVGGGCVVSQFTPKHTTNDI